MRKTFLEIVGAAILVVISSSCATPESGQRAPGARTARHNGNPEIKLDPGPIEISPPTGSPTGVGKIRCELKGTLGQNCGTTWKIVEVGESSQPLGTNSGFKAAGSYTLKFRAPDCVEPWYVNNVPVLGSSTPTLVRISYKAR
jgi:hypothetical protein